MSREIRRVPADWQHPKSERYPDRYQPLYNKDFMSEARKWLDEAIAWDNGTHPDLVNGTTTKEEHPFFWQWDQRPPDKEYYRPAWPEESRTHYQVYETVSEGTPVSPVLESLDAVTEWAVRQGYSRHAAERFVANGWAPSAVARNNNGRIEFGSDIAAYDVMGKGEK